MRTDVELAWAAGLFDGEGHISARRVKVKPREDGVERYGRRLQFRITQKYPEVLERFKASVGLGKIYKQERTHHGAYGPIYTYVIYGRAQIHEVCTLILPWVSPVKHRQITEALAQFDAWGPTHVMDRAGDTEEK